MAWGGFKDQNTSPKNTKTWDPFSGIRKGKLSGAYNSSMKMANEDNFGRPKTVAGVGKISSQILEDSVLGDAAKRYGTKRVKGMS